MDDLISRKQAIDGKISIQCANGVEIYSDEAVPVEYLKALPSAQPEPKTGHWIILDSDSERCEDIKCPFCGHTFTVDAWRWCDIGFIKEDFNFCPNCGAHMKGVTTT